MDEYPAAVPGSLGSRRATGRWNDRRPQAAKLQMRPARTVLNMRGSVPHTPRSVRTAMFIVQRRPFEATSVRSGMLNRGRFVRCTGPS
jgi:hypothetical protein